jgi:hypothetical protein
MLKNIKTPEQVNTEKFNIAMENLRQQRNKLLADTDYLALSDNTMTEEIKTYRQKLRDITEGLITKEQVEAEIKALIGA